MHSTAVEKQCHLCSASYFSKSCNAKYCEACRTNIKSNYNKYYKKNQKEQKKKNQKEKERIKAEFKEIVKKAKQEGLSYGEYVARMEGRL